jgi:hypothetical protein
MTSKKLLATLALSALSAAPLSALANPTYFNAEFGYTGTTVTQFTSGGVTYQNGNSSAPGINTATSITVENPFYITSMSNSIYGAPNDFTTSLFTPFKSQGYIVNPAPSGLFTLTIPQNGTVNSLSSIPGPFAQITGNNGDVFSFIASKDFVGGSSAPIAGSNQSSLTVNVLGTISDSQNQYLATPASFQLVVSDSSGGLSFGGTFAAPPAVTITSVPEPGSLLLVGIGALGLGLCSRKFKFSGRMASGLQGAAV